MDRDAHSATQRRIIDPREEQITVLRLAGKRYVVHGEFGKGTVASSHLLSGFEVSVSKVFFQQFEPSTKKTSRKSKRKSS